MEQLQVILLGVQPYKFTDESTQKQVSGCSAWFIEKTMQNDEYGKGFLPKKATLPYEMYEQLKGLDFPHVASPEIATQFTAKGIRTKIAEFKAIKKASIN